jgi:hypothetical protein
MRLLAIATALAILVDALPSAMASLLHAGIPSLDVKNAMSNGVELIGNRNHKRKYKRLKPGCRAAFCKPGYNYGKYYREKRKRKFARQIVRGIILGAVIVTVAGVVPNRPGPEYCWRWSNSARTRGYWDWCY